MDFTPMHPIVLQISRLQTTRANDKEWNLRNWGVNSTNRTLCPNRATVGATQCNLGPRSRPDRPQSYPQPAKHGLLAILSIQFECKLCYGRDWDLSNNGSCQKRWLMLINGLSTIDRFNYEHNEVAHKIGL